MNNFNIHLEIRNPKKQAMDTKLEALACYLMNQRMKSRGTDHGAPLGRQRLGLGFGEAMRRWMGHGDAGAAMEMLLAAAL